MHLLRSLSQRSTSLLQPIHRRLVRGGDHHYKGYNEPGGHFCNIPPPPAGFRRKKYWFEYWWYYVYGGTFLAWAVAVYYRPEPELEMWARHEAMLRMKERGETFEDAS